MYRDNIDDEELIDITNKMNWLYYTCNTQTTRHPYVSTPNVVYILGVCE
ncbi:protein of unknown function (plasmid) [Vibrio harveyi]|nr:protein of unknown function [Vibrio harveyi]